jgi:hypothetical protein
MGENVKYSIIKILSLGKCFKMVLKEIHDLEEHDNIPGELIPSIFIEKKYVLHADNMSILKRNYLK